MSMPPRPSRNLDRALLAAGRALLPQRGCAGLTIREVAEAAGVNLGMFHYHFKSREAFLRALLQSLYEDMYAQLTFQADEKLGPVEALRAAMRFMTRFVRGNRAILSRVLADALTGDAIAREFLRNNFPRHIGVIHRLIEAGQAEGLFKPMPVPQAMGFCIGSLAMPILFGGAVAESGTLGPAGTKMLTEAVLSDAALDQRIEMALGAISVSTSGAPAKPARRARKPRGKS
jgi:AcrR family transcriptional regulator